MRRVAPLLLILAAVSLSRPARAQLCGASVPNSAAQGAELRFSAPSHSCGKPTPGACYWLVSPPSGGTRQYQSCSFTISADQTGIWRWDLASYTPDCHQCGDSGSINVYPNCAVNVTASATPKSPSETLFVTFEATVSTVGGCSGPVTSKWTFGDGQESTALKVDHEYARVDEYSWTFTATSSGVTSSRSGTVFLPCLKVGGLGLCGPKVVQDAKDSSVYDIVNLFHIEEVFRSDGHVRFKGSPSGGYGLLSVDQDLYALLARGKEPLIQGKNLLFDVRGSENALHPDAGNPMWLTYTLGGLPLLGTGSTTYTFGSKRVDLKSQGWFGVPDLLDLGRLETTVRMTKSGQDELVSARGTVGNVTPTIQVVDVDMKYNPATKQASVKTKAGLPFVSGGFKLDATWFFSNCGCGLDGFNIVVPANAVPGTEVLNLLVPSVWGLKPKVSAYRIETQSLCRGARDLLGLSTDQCPVDPPFTLGLFGRLVVGTPLFDIPGEVFRIDNVGLRYRHPMMFTIAGGSAQLLGYTFAEAKGVLSLKSYPSGAYLDGWASAAGLVEGQANLLLSLSRGLLTGTMTGKIQIPNFTCTVQAFVCKTTKAILEEAFGGLPAVATDVALTAIGHIPIFVSGPAPPQSELFLRGEVKVGKYRPVLQFTSIQAGTSLPSVSMQFGSSLSSMYNLFGSGSALAGAENAASAGSSTAPTALALAQKTFAIPEARDVVFFIAEGVSSIPDLYVVDPTGRRVTPSNVATYPGARYLSSAENRVAILEIGPVDRGTWTVGSATDGASADALGVKTAPVTTFSRVNISGTTASLDAAVVPASAGTTVRFLLGRGTADGGGEPVTEALDASSGSVSTVVDLGAAPSGRYVLLALTDDGMNPPVLTAYTEPIVLDTESIRPPTGLTGTRSGTRVDLRWTPSPTAGVAAYTVLYTDTPDAGTFRYGSTALNRDRASIGGLDPSKSYRFAVQASNADGASSPESEPWYTTAPAADVTPLARGVAVSGLLAPAALRHFRVVVPAGSTALRIRASGSSDPDLYVKKGAKASTSAWDYRSATAGRTDESVDVTTSSTPQPLAAGEWFVALSARAAGSFSIVADIERPGTECAIVAAATVPRSAGAGAPVTFQGTVVSSRCSGETGWDWDFKDGSPHATTPSATHAYAAVGTYAWTLTVRRGTDTSIASGTIVIGGTGSGLPGDCDGNGIVSADEVQRAVNMHLGIEPAACGVDTNRDGIVTIDELQRVINAFLGVTAALAPS